MPVTIDVTKDELYLDGLEKGLFDGKREGLYEGERNGKMAGLLEGIEGMLELKFGSASLELMNMVRVLNTIDKLEEFKNLIKKVGSVDELKVVLGKSV